MKKSGNKFKILLRSARQPGYIASLICTASLLTASGTAFADPEDTLNFALGGGVRFEENLFRFSDDVDEDSLPGSPHKSDMIYSANAGIKINKLYSQQQFMLNVMLTENKFQQNSFLDYSEVDYTAAWFWHLTPRISGIILADQQQSLVNFSDFRSFDDSNVQTSQFRMFSIDGDLGAGWHAIGALTDITARTNQNFQEIGDYEQTGVELGGKYVSRADNWISLVQRESDGNYNRDIDLGSQLDEGFEDSETEAKLYWELTGKSTIDARLGHLERKHDNFSDRDFSGMVGKFLYKWQATGKVELNASVSRSLISFQSSNYSYYIAETFSISPVWSITSKSKLWLRYDIGTRDHRGAIVANAERRDDVMQSFVIAGEWNPTRTIKVGAGLQHDRRTSSLDRFEYDASSANITAQLLF